MGRTRKGRIEAWKMPHQSGQTSEAYEQLAVALEQLGRLDEVQREIPVQVIA